MCANVLLASLLKGISEADKKCSVMKSGRCTWINLPELLDSADKQNLLCQLCQYIAQYRGGGEQKEVEEKKATGMQAANIKFLYESEFHFYQCN